MFTVFEVAAALKVEPSTVYRWARNGEIPSVRVAGIVRIPARALEAFIRNAGPEPEEKDA